MDLLGCPGCNERFVLRDSGTGEGWACEDCNAELRVIAHGVSLEILEPESLEPNQLQRVSRSPSGPPFRTG